MTQHIGQRQAVNVGFESGNLSEAVNLLQWIASQSKLSAASGGLVTTQLATRESLMLRAEQPFLEDRDHVVHGRVYGLRDDNFAVVYDAVPSVLESSIETRNGRPATVLAKFWICP
jgi:hypothetical protein